MKKIIYLIIAVLLIAGIVASIIVYEVTDSLNVLIVAAILIVASFMFVFIESIVTSLKRRSWIFLVFKTLVFITACVFMFFIGNSFVLMERKQVEIDDVNVLIQQAEKDSQNERQLNDEMLQLMREKTDLAMQARLQNLALSLTLLSKILASWIENLIWERKKEKQAG